MGRMLAPTSFWLAFVDTKSLAVSLETSFIYRQFFLMIHAANIVVFADNGKK
jgi:hypothetical protein